MKRSNGMKKALTLLLVLAMTVSMFVGCGTAKTGTTDDKDSSKTETTTETKDEAKEEAKEEAPQTGSGKYIGISMPTQSSERWIKDGATMKEILEARGYTVDLQYAEDDIPTQKSQIENMITKGAEVLVECADLGAIITIDDNLKTSTDSSSEVKI